MTPDMIQRTQEDEYFYYKKKYPDVAWNYEPLKTGVLVVCEPIIEVKQNWDIEILSQYKAIITFNRKFAEQYNNTDRFSSRNHVLRMRDPNYRDRFRHLRNRKEKLRVIAMQGVPFMNQYWEIEKHTPYEDRINGVVCLNKCEANIKGYPYEIYGLRKTAMEGLRIAPTLTKHVYARSPWGEEMYQGHIPHFHSHLENLKVLDRYKFCVCFESTYDPMWSWDFLTERMFNCFRTKTIPIYYGCYNVEQWVPKHLFIDYRDYIAQPEKLADFLLSFDKKKYTEMTEEAFAWNKTHRIGNINDMEQLVIQNR